MSKEFKLSACLYGHSMDVRCVKTTKDNNIVSGSRDKTAKLWSPNGINPGFSEAMTYRDQKNFVIAVQYLPPSEGYPDGVIVTGGNDNIIYIYKPSEPFASHTIKAHTNAVSCISAGLEAGTFLTGSWDNSAKAWSLADLSRCKRSLEGHKAAVWDVLQVQSGGVVTASADRTIILWGSDGAPSLTLTAHTDCVRGLAELPALNQFVSVSNDATIRRWTLSGDLLDTYYGHTNFIYSVAARTSSSSALSFVSADEDRTVRVWEDGVNCQTFHLPAQSVWSVACLPNGDIVTGSSDGLVRVFTQDERRFADADTLLKFGETVAALARQNLQEIGGYKVSDLPGVEALYDPGRAAGQIKMVREGGGVVAYSWVAEGASGRWEKVGDVLGAGAANKTTFEGKEYDFVFSVDVEDGKPPLKLPFNRGEDVYKAANAFLTRNVLPASYLEQVVDFILKNTKEAYVPPPTSANFVDPFTGGSRYTPNNPNQAQTDSGGQNLDPFTGSSSYSTAPLKETRYFPIASYRIFDMGDPKIIFAKLKEFAQKTNTEIDDNTLANIVQICTGPAKEPQTFDSLFKLLDWPKECIFPVLDVVRMAVRDQKNNQIISTINKGILMQTLLCFVSNEAGIANNRIVALRTLCNLFLHEHGEDLVFTNCYDLFETITAIGELNKNAQVALGTLLLNLVIAAIKRKDELVPLVLADVIPDTLQRLTDPEAQYRAYVALGTLLVESSERNELIKKIQTNSAFVTALQLHLLAGGTDLEIKKRNCAKQVQDVINLS